MVKIQILVKNPNINQTQKSDKNRDFSNESLICEIKFVK